VRRRSNRGRVEPVTRVELISVGVRPELLVSLGLRRAAESQNPMATTSGGAADPALCTALRCTADGETPTQDDQACLIAEISNSSTTLSPTSIPPVSRVAFQVTPKSLRLIVVEPSKPIRVLPNGSVAVPS
jgi:hypothetical protein